MTLPSLLRRARKYDADITYRTSSKLWLVKLYDFRPKAVITSAMVLRPTLAKALAAALKAMVEA